MTSKDKLSAERLRNTRAWAAVRVGTLSGAEVIVGAIDELLQMREDWETICAAADAMPAVETTTTHPDTARLDWILQDYRGVDLYNALDGQIGVCTDNLNEIRAAIDKMIAKDSAAEKASVRHWEMPCQICGAHRGADGEIRHLPSCELSVNGNGDV